MKMPDMTKLMKAIQDAEAVAPGVAVVIGDVVDLFNPSSTQKLFSPGGVHHVSKCPEGLKGHLTSLGLSRAEIIEAERAGFDWGAFMGKILPLIQLIISLRKGGPTPTTPVDPTPTAS